MSDLTWQERVAVFTVLNKIEALLEKIEQYAGIDNGVRPYANKS